MGPKLPRTPSETRLKSKLLVQLCSGNHGTNRIYLHRGLTNGVGAALGGTALGAALGAGGDDANTK